jgi:DNA-binding beta-propeller fold protein YncE
LLAPVGLGVDAHRNVYVADSEANRVQKYGPDGGWLASFASAGFEGSPFNGPRDVAVDADGNVIVADTNNNRIVGLLPDGELAWELERFAGPEGGDDEFYEPFSICAAAGRLAVADTNNNRVLLFDSQRQFLFAAEGEFVFPSGVRMTPDGGRICVADNGNLRVRRFDSAGRRDAEVVLSENPSDAPVVPGGSQLAAAPDGQALMVQPGRVIEVRLDAAG